MTIEVRVLDDKYDAIGDDISLGELPHIPLEGEVIHIQIPWIKDVPGAHWVPDDELAPLEVVRREFIQKDDGWLLQLYCVGSERYGYKNVFRKFVNFKNYAHN